MANDDDDDELLQQMCIVTIWNDVQNEILQVVTPSSSLSPHVLSESCAAVVASLGKAIAVLQGTCSAPRMQRLLTHSQLYYIDFISFLLKHVGPNWLALMCEKDRRECFDAFIYSSYVPSPIALLAVCVGLSSSSSRSSVSRHVSTGVALSASSLELVQLDDSLNQSYSGKVDVFTTERVCDIIRRGNDSTGLNGKGSFPSCSASFSSPLLRTAFQQLWTCQSSSSSSNTARDVTQRSEEDPRDTEDVAAELCASQYSKLFPNRLACALLRLPHRLSNILGARTPRDFLPEPWAGEVCRAALAEARTEALTSAATVAVVKGGGRRRGETVGLLFWKALIDRVVTMGCASQLIQSWRRAIVCEMKELTSSASWRTDMAERESEGDVAASQEEEDDGNDSAGGDWAKWEHSAAAQAHAELFCAIPGVAVEAVALTLLKGMRSSNSDESHSRRRSSGGRAGAGDDVGREGDLVIGRVLLGRCVLAEQRSSSLDIDDGRSGSGDGLGGLRVHSSAPLTFALTHKVLLTKNVSEHGCGVIASALHWCDVQAKAYSDSHGGKGEYKRRGSGGGGHDKEGEEGGLMDRTACRVAAVWAEPSLLHNTPVRQQAVLTAFLIKALELGRGAGPELLVLLLRGVGNRLEVGVKEIRVQGMRVGEALGAAMEQPLRFDELHDNDDDNADVGNGSKGGRATKMIVKDGARMNRRKKRRAKVAGAPPPRPLPPAGPAVMDLDPDAVLAVDSSDDEGEHGEGVTDESTTWQRSVEGKGGDAGEGDSEGGKKSEGSDVDDDEVGSWGSLSGDELGDDDEDEVAGRRGGFEAYALSDNDRDLSSVPEPLYLREVLRLLRSRDADDTPDSHEAALRVIPKLVAKAPHDLYDVASELLLDLLYLDNTYNLDHFEERRVQAIVCTCCAAPEPGALLLCEQLFNSSTSEGTKMEILDALVASTRELAGYGSADEGGARSGGGCSRTTTGLLKDKGEGKGSKEEDDVVGEDLFSLPRNFTQGRQSRLGPANSDKETGQQVSKTRRWGYRRSDAPRVIRNHFGPLAPLFFYPLVHGYASAIQVGEDDERHGIWLHGDSWRLCASLVNALARVVQCAGRSPGTPTLAADLLAFSWSFHHNPHSELRRAVLLAIMVALQHMKGPVVAVFLERGVAVKLWVERLSAPPSSSSSAMPEEFERKACRAILTHDIMQAIAI